MFVFSIVFMLLGSISSAYSYTYSVSGYVRNQYGVAVPFATVTITPREGCDPPATERPERPERHFHRGLTPSGAAHYNYILPIEKLLDED